MQWNSFILSEDLRSLRAYKHSPFACKFRHHFFRILEEAAKMGKISILNEFNDVFISSKSLPLFEAAAQKNHLNVINWLKQKKYTRSEKQFLFSRAVQCAAEKGHYNIVKAMFDEDVSPNINLETILSAVKNGFLDCLQYLLDKIDLEKNHYNTIFCCAIENGHVHILDWISSDQKITMPPSDVLHSCVKNGHLQILKWLYLRCIDFRIHIGSEFIKTAILHGQSTIAGWLIETFFPTEQITFDLIHEAVRRGNINILQWVLEFQSFTHEEWKEDAIASIIEHGDVLILRFLQNNNCRMMYSNQTLLKSLQIGKIKITNFLFTGLVYISSPEFIDQLAATGQLDSLIWICNHSSKNSNEIEIFQSSAMDKAAANGYLEVVQWLDENQTSGCTSEAMDLAAANGHFKMVEWLHFYRIEGCSGKAFSNAAKNGHLNIFIWLCENYPKYHQTSSIMNDALQEADRNGHFDIMDWILKNTSFTFILNTE